MAILVSAIVVVGVIGLVNLVLLFGVIRRLREHGDALASAAGAAGREMMTTGTAVDFSATTVDGRVVSTGSLTDANLLGVFSTTCAPCLSALPAFVERAAAQPGGRDHVLTLVVGDGEAEAAPFLSALAGVAKVVREPIHGPMATAFGVTGYPAFGLVDGDGIVRFSSASPAGLPEPATA